MANKVCLKDYFTYIQLGNDTPSYMPIKISIGDEVINSSIKDLYRYDYSNASAETHLTNINGTILNDDITTYNNLAETVRTGDGNDTIAPEWPGHYNVEYADTVYAGEGDDDISYWQYNGYTSNENIRLYGEGGNDTISITQGIAYGGTGNDSITVSMNYNNETETYTGATVYGGTGTDSLDSADDLDTIYGANGADVLYGSKGKDYIYGAGDNDYIDGGANDDTLIGGDGNDTIYGGDGADKIYSIYEDTDVSSSRYSGYKEIHGGAGNDTIYMANEESDVWTDEGDDLVISSYSSTNTYHIRNGEGNDSIVSSKNSDEKIVFEDMNFNTDDITATYDLDNNKVVIYYNKVDGEYKNTVTLLHYFEVKGGTEVIEGYDEYDNPIYKYDEYGFYVKEGTDPFQAETDSDIYSGLDTLVDRYGNTLSLKNILGSGQIVGAKPEDRTAFSDNFILNEESAYDWTTYEMSGGDDTVTVSYNHNSGIYIRGGSGNDSLVGSDSTECLSGDSGDDILKGNGGDDTLQGGSGNDSLYGGDGDDSIYGNDGNDYIEGGKGSNRLEGNDGDDTIVSWSVGGDDVLMGGKGANLYEFVYVDRDPENPEELAFVAEIHSESLDDKINFRSISNSNNLTFYIDSEYNLYANYYITSSDKANTIIIRNWTRQQGDYEVTFNGGNSAKLFDLISQHYVSNSIDFVSGNDIHTNSGMTNIMGTSSSDTINSAMTGSDEQSRKIWAGSGDDSITAYTDNMLSQSVTIYGGDGDDYIAMTGKNAQNDTVAGVGLAKAYIDGGRGDDSIYGGRDADTIFGGAGADTINPGFGDDIIFTGVHRLEDTTMDDVLERANSMYWGGYFEKLEDAGEANNVVIGNNGPKTVYAIGENADISWSGSGDIHVSLANNSIINDTNLNSGTNNLTIHQLGSWPDAAIFMNVVANKEYDAEHDEYVVTGTLEDNTMYISEYNDMSNWAWGNGTIDYDNLNYGLITVKSGEMTFDRITNYNEYYIEKDTINSFVQEVAGWLTSDGRDYADVKTAFSSGDDVGALREMFTTFNYPYDTGSGWVNPNA